MRPKHCKIKFRLKREGQIMNSWPPVWRISPRISFFLIPLFKVGLLRNMHEMSVFQKMEMQMSCKASRARVITCAAGPRASSESYGRALAKNTPLGPIRSRTYTRNESHFAQLNYEPKSVRRRVSGRLSASRVLLKDGTRARKQQEHYCNTAGTSAAIKPPANACVRKCPCWI
jgi:hypothetical protein